MITEKKLLEIIGKTTSMPNVKSLVAGLESFGEESGLNSPHRLAMFLGQVLHESQYLRYDKEIWGPTRAQKRYDTRTDLGNTAAVDGDGYRYRGRGPIQITGKYNYARYTMWARQNIGNHSPNFVNNPDLINTDPWEGLVPIWYWHTHNLNRFADKGDIRKLTRAINGGYNGLADRQRWTDRASLKLLGFGTTKGAVKRFQTKAGITADGALGPQTRRHMHLHLKQAKPL